MRNARRRGAVLFDRDGYRANDTDDVVEAGIFTDQPGALSTPQQSLPFQGDRIAARRPVLDDSS